MDQREGESVPCDTHYMQKRSEARDLEGGRAGSTLNLFTPVDNRKQAQIKEKEGRGDLRREGARTNEFPREKGKRGVNE